MGPLRLRGSRATSAHGDVDNARGRLLDRGVPVTVRGTGNGPVAAFVDALSQLDVQVSVLDYAEHALSAGGDADRRGLRRVRDRG